MGIIRKFKNKIHLKNARRASKKYGHPHEKLKIIGVTGTDGKTTTTSMIYHILRENGFKVGYISTTEARINTKVIDTGLHVTSPEPQDLPKYLDMMVKEGIEYAILEATSNGLDQNRFGDILFDAAVVTNINEDHLDYHKSWENYAKAKFKLLEKLKEESVVVLNKDDEESAKWLRKKSETLPQNIYVKWSTKSNTSYLKTSFQNLEFTYDKVKFDIPIFGSLYNLDNVLQAIMLCETLIPLKKVSQALKTYKLPKGRLEIMCLNPIKIIVDFAHTPDALENVLSSIKNVLPDNKRLITIFGCAGKRDKGRRKMGAVSAQFSDLTILTAEDPRNEKLSQINSEIFKTAQNLGGVMITRFKNHDDYALTSLGELHAMIETVWQNNEVPFIAFDQDSKMSRRDAIELGIRLARRGDCIFVTGKGHEKSLAFGKQEKEYAWSDQEEVQDALNRLKII